MEGTSICQIRLDGSYCGRYCVLRYTLECLIQGAPLKVEYNASEQDWFDFFNAWGAFQSKHDGIFAL